jgi:hypothetical protein
LENRIAQLDLKIEQYKAETIERIAQLDIKIERTKGELTRFLLTAFIIQGLIIALTYLGTLFLIIQAIKH